MHTRPIRFAITVLFAAAAFGQDPTGQSIGQQFYFTYTQDPVGLREIANAIRGVGEITQASLNTDAKSLTVSGTPAQLAMASWMITTMDQPAPANQATREYRPEGSVNDVVRMVYLSHPGTRSSFQEIVNSVRTIPQMTKLFPYVAQNAIVMRGADSQVEMAEWLFHQLDLPAGMQPVQDPAAHRYVLPPGAIGSEHVDNSTVQVLFLAHPWDADISSPQSMQQIVNVVRSIPQLTFVFPCVATGALTLRGPANTLALAAWLFSQLDRAPRVSTLSPQEFRMPGAADDVTQVFYMAPATTAESLQSIAEAVRPTVNQHVMYDAALNALTLRGRASQIAAADRLIDEFVQNQAKAPAAQSASQVFHFTYAQAPIDVQQITNAIRTVGQITQAYPNADAKTLTVSGTPAQLAMAAWIFTAMDQPMMDQPGPANRATQEFRPAGSVNDVVRMLYLTQPQTPTTFQEILNAVRTIPEVTKAFPYTAHNAVLMRGTDDQAAMSEWLFHQLDLPAGMQPVQDLSAHRYESPILTAHNGNEEMRVLFLSHAWSQQSMQEIVNAVRTIPQLTKVFPCTATGAVAVRGLPATLALATWLFNQMDQAPPAATTAPQEFQMPGGADDVTQVFYLAPGTSAASLQSVVNAVRSAVSQHAFPNTTLNALVLRGSATQIAAADSLIKQMNQP